MHKEQRRGFNRALKRFALISRIEALILAGESLGGAIAKVFERQDEGSGMMSRSSIYRWHKAYRAGGFDALFDEPRPPKKSSLQEDFLQFIQNEKNHDPGASIPEVIARARERKIIAPSQAIDRSTVYRTARALNLPILRRKRAEATNMRPFAYESRMMMVLCDGKHFRAGASGLKRVALFFIDDATRYVLDVFVGTSEDSELFLRGVHRILETFGHMGGLYLDKGPGFIADDSVKVMATLNIPFIHGKSAYPEGRAKIERFNSTVTQALMRGLKKAGIDPACSALELRFRHYIRERYNQQIHSRLNAAPSALFEEDKKPLAFPLSLDDLKRAFVMPETRKVRRDNVIEFHGLGYEVPLGYAGRRIKVFRDLLSPKIWVLHLGIAVELHPPDLALNARLPRSSLKRNEPPSAVITTAAELHFNKDYRPIVGADGGFPISPS